MYWYVQRPLAVSDPFCVKTQNSKILTEICGKKWIQQGPSYSSKLLIINKMWNRTSSNLRNQILKLENPVFMCCLVRNATCPQCWNLISKLTKPMPATCCTFLQPPRRKPLASKDLNPFHTHHFAVLFPNCNLFISPFYSPRVRG